MKPYVAPLQERRLLASINKELAKEQKVMRICRDVRDYPYLGEYYVTNQRADQLIDVHIYDLIDYARYLGVPEAQIKTCVERGGQSLPEHLVRPDGEKEECYVLTPKAKQLALDLAHVFQRKRYLEERQ